MGQYRYSLEKGSRRFVCPACNKRKLKRYVDAVTGDYLPEQYGRCNSEANCTYHNSPYKDGYSKMIWQQEQGNNPKNLTPPARPISLEKSKKEPVFIPIDVLCQTLAGYEQNVFLQNLLGRVPFPFEVADIERVVAQYRLGTIKKGYRAGAITFPFIDRFGNVRTIQVKQFDEANHTKGTDFLHSIIKKHYQEKDQPLPDWLLAYEKNEIQVSCLFGSHLLDKYRLNPIALVEAPKTAIYGTLYFGFPDNPENLLWMGVYNLSSLNYEKCKDLIGRVVYLFPDLSKTGKAFELWSAKAKELSDRMPGTTFKVSDLLEKNAAKEQRDKGRDLADYVIPLDWREFRNKFDKNKEALKENSSSALTKHEAPNQEFSDSNNGMKKPQQSEFVASDMEGPARNKGERNASPETFDPKEFKQWFDALPQLPPQIYIQQGLTVYNADWFVTGRLNHIKAFTGHQEQGNRSSFIHQLQQFRKRLEQ